MMGTAKKKTAKAAKPARTKTAAKRKTPAAKRKVGRPRND